MADKPVTRSEASNNLPDNTSGAITPKDLRTAVLSAHQLPGYTSVTDGDGSPDNSTNRAAAIDSAISRVQNRGELVGVVVPSTYLNFATTAVSFDTNVTMIVEAQAVEIPSVEAFGAAGDRSTGSDVDAIEAASSWANANGRLDVWHPPATYNVSSDPSFAGNTRPRGVNATYSGSTVAVPDVVDESVTVSAGTGLSGGGDLSADRTLSFNFDSAHTWNGAQTFGGDVTFASSYNPGSTAHAARPVVHHATGSASAVGIPGAIHTEDAT